VLDDGIGKYSINSLRYLNASEVYKKQRNNGKIYIGNLKIYSGGV